MDSLAKTLTSAATRPSHSLRSAAALSLLSLAAALALHSGAHAQGLRMPDGASGGGLGGLSSGGISSSDAQRSNTQRSNQNASPQRAAPASAPAQRPAAASTSGNKASNTKANANTKTNTKTNAKANTKTNAKTNTKASSKTNAKASNKAGTKASARASTKASSARTRSSTAPYANDLHDAAANAQASASANRQGDHIVALVNSEPITHIELQNRIESARAALAQRGQDMSETALQQQVLDLLIAERLQLQEARELKLTIDDFTLEQAERSVAEQNGVSVSAMYQELAASGVGREEFRNQLRNQLTLMRVRERAVESRTRVSDRELDQYLRENPVDLGQPMPDALNLGHVLVVVPEQANAAQEAEYKARIDQARQQLQQGRSLAEVASEFSDANEARHGGELGLRPTTQYPELFLQAVENQPVGTLVGPIRSPAGYHLLQVIDRQSGGAGMVVRNHARHILITPGSGRSAQEAGQMLMEIRQRVIDGREDFAALARQYSQDGSASEGGDLGWVGPGVFVPEFQEALDELRPGDVSMPVVSRYGLHLIQLIDRRQEKVTQREQREIVRAQAREAKVEKEYIRWIEGLRARAFVEMRNDG